MSDQELPKLTPEDIAPMILRMEREQQRMRAERDRRILVGHERARRDPVFRYRVTTIANDLLDSPHLKSPPEAQDYDKVRTAMEIAIRVLVVDEWVREVERL